MNCTDTRQHLSAYFDDELSPDIRAELAEHLQSCADCSAALARTRSLSALAHELPDPAASDLWPSIQRDLNQPKLVEPAPLDRLVISSRWDWPLVTIAVAASLLIGFFTWPLLHSHDAHNQMGVTIARYIEEFRNDPVSAERYLRHEYVGQSIEPADAIRLVNYKPLAPEKLSDGAIRTQTYLFEMPCCKCIQTLYHRPDGRSLAVFEHVDDDRAWFGKRSIVHTNCSHKDVCLVECDGQLVVTWQEGKRFITLVGVKDVDEVSRLVPAFTDSST